MTIDNGGQVFAVNPLDRAPPAPRAESVWNRGGPVAVSAGITLVLHFILGFGSQCYVFCWFWCIQNGQFHKTKYMNAKCVQGIQVLVLEEQRKRA